MKTPITRKHLSIKNFILDISVFPPPTISVLSVTSTFGKKDYQSVGAESSR